MFHMTSLLGLVSFLLVELCLAAGKNGGNLEGGKSLNVDLMMPGVRPKEDNTYLCFSTKINKTLYITGFKPKASMSVAHHMLVFGCSEPGEVGTTPWNCGEMESKSEKYKQGPVCKTGQTIMYAWGMDAPALALPNKVAFKVGKASDIAYLVLQIHYKDVSSFLPPNNGKDSSGVTLKATTVSQPKLAGVFLLGTEGEISPRSTTYMETACLFNEDVVLHPFGFRVHAHKHGKIVSGYRVRNGQWTEIGRKSPQDPQMFYPVEKPDVTITKGDILAARCTMVNDEDVAIPIGPTTNDEMCNFYIMYYVEGDKAVKDRLCVSPGPPSWNWNNFDGINLESVPRNASVIPNTDTFLKETRNQIKAINQKIEKQKEKMGERFRNLLKNEMSDRLRTWDRPGFLWQEDDVNPDVPNWDERERDFAPFGFNDDSSLDRFLMFDDAELQGGRFPEQFEGGDQQPSQTETFSVIDDKNGGKGYEKTKNLFKPLRIPGGNGFYKESRKESAFSWGTPPEAGEI